MKKFLPYLLCTALLSSILIFSGAAKATYVPGDGEFQNVWGAPGTEIYDATDKGVKLEWTAPDCDWGCRVTYVTPVALDGLTITLTDFNMAEDEAGFVVGFTNGIGEYVDSNGVFFDHSNKSGTTTVSAFMPLALTESGEAPFMQPTATDSVIASGTVTMSFKKNGDTWTYDINGCQFTFPDSFVTRMLTNPNKVYLCLCTGHQFANSVSFNVASVKTEDVTAGAIDPSVVVDPQTVTANAYMPTDGEFANVWGAPGVEIYDATEYGVPLDWISADGADWGGRLTYVNAVDLDGLKIVLTGVKMPAANGTLALGITNQIGEWVDAKGLFFYHNAQSNSKEPVYVNAKCGLVYTSTKVPFIDYLPLNKAFDGTVTITFNKLEDGDWAYTVNGISARIPGEEVADELTNSGKVYVAFCTGYGNTDLSFTVSNISDKNTPASDEAEAALTAAIEHDAASKTTEPSGTGTNGDVNQNNGDTSGKVSGAPRWIVPAIVLAVLAVGCGVVVFLLIKTGKKPKSASDDNLPGDQQ